MNGELAQVIALATHGTAWLRHPSAPAPSLERANSTFQYVRSVAFRDERPRGVRRRRTESASVQSWLGHLRERGVERLWLAIPTPQARHVGEHTFEAHMLIAFAGAGTWLMLADAPRGTSQWWGAQWEVGDREAADQRIWDVRYRGLAAAATGGPPRPGITESAESLRRALVTVHDFASAHELTPWTDWFAKALDALADDDPRPPHHPDMVPASHPKEARRLMAAAAQSWVFGGMGSWNDLGFGEPEEEAAYRNASRALYDAVLVSFVAAANVDL